MLFLRFEKSFSKKIAPGFLGFVSMRFNLLFFSVKMSYRDVLGFVCMLFINIVTFKKLLL